MLYPGLSLVHCGTDYPCRRLAQLDTAADGPDSDAADRVFVTGARAVADRRQFDVCQQFDAAVVVVVVVVGKVSAPDRNTTLAAAAADDDDDIAAAAGGGQIAVFVYDNAVVGRDVPVQPQTVLDWRRLLQDVDDGFAYRDRTAPTHWGETTHTLDTLVTRRGNVTVGSSTVHAAAAAAVVIDAVDTVDSAVYFAFVWLAGTAHVAAVILTCC